MIDMLVKLYEINDDKDYLQEIADEEIIIKRAITSEKHIVLNWVNDTFSSGWESQCAVSFYRDPVSCFIAIKDNKIIGFACYNATYKGLFGPEGILENYRGKGIGKALLLSCLQAMKAEGFAYAIIGGAGPTEFYKKICGAEVIEGSNPGIFKNRLT